MSDCTGAVTHKPYMCPLQARQYQEVCSALADVEARLAGTAQDLGAKNAAVERLEGEAAALRAQLQEGSALLEAADARAAALQAAAAAKVRHTL
jgi:chromosome segregation ATPase